MSREAAETEISGRVLLNFVGRKKRLIHLSIVPLAWAGEHSVAGYPVALSIIRNRWLRQAKDGTF